MPFSIALPLSLLVTKFTGEQQLYRLLRSTIRNPLVGKLYISFEIGNFVSSPWNMADSARYSLLCLLTIRDLCSHGKSQGIMAPLCCSFDHRIVWSIN